MVPERLLPGSKDWIMYIEEHTQRYQFAAKYSNDLTVLDAACGVGYGSQILASSGAKHVIGVDISYEAIDIAKKNYQGTNCDFRTSDVTNLPFENDSFDLVVSFETIEHIPNPEAFLKEIRRVLRPGGTIICSTPNKDFIWNEKKQTGKNPYHLSEMTFEEFLNLFSVYFLKSGWYFQTHSASYIRHFQLIEEIDRVNKSLQTSIFLRLENFIRTIFRKGRFSFFLISPEIARAVPGDYIIEKLDEPKDTYLTYIFIGNNSKKNISELI